MRSRDANPSKTPELFLERHALSELSEQEASGLDASELEAARGRIEGSNREILGRLPAEMVVPAIRSRYAIERNRAEALGRGRVRARRAYWAVAATAAAAAAVLLMVLPATPGERPGESAQAPATETRIKGPEKPFLAVYRDSEHGVERLPHGAAVSQGDLIQLTYISKGREHGVVLSIDGAGGVTLHWPETTDGATSLEPKGEIPLVHAYELDAAPGYERFVFVTSSQRIDVGEVLEAARELTRDGDAARTRPLKLPSGWEQTSLVLKKVQP